MRRAMLGCLFALFSLGCVSQSTPVRLQGDPLTIGSLAGHWVGQFSGGAEGRGGSLSLALRTGSDSLYGDVTMIEPSGHEIRGADPMGAHQMQMQSAQQLRIDFAWADGTTRARGGRIVLLALVYMHRHLGILRRGGGRPHHRPLRDEERRPRADGRSVGDEAGERRGRASSATRRKGAVSRANA